MTVPRRVWGGTSLLIVGRLWGSACTFVYLLLLARHLAGADFGRLTFYLALFMVLDSLVDLGTGQAAIQRTASDEDAVAGVLWATRRIRFVAGLVGVALVGGGALLAREPGAWWILAASLYPVTHVLELSTLVHKNRIAWGRPVLVRMVAAGLSLGFVGVFLATGARSPALFLFAIALGSAVGNGLLHLSTRALLPPRGPRTAIGPILRAALPMGIAGLCQQTYFYVDNLFVRWIEGPEAVGHYNVAVRVMSYGIMVAVYAPLTALPWLTREWQSGRLGPAVTRIAQPLFALAGLGIGLVWRWCEPILALFGESFVAAGPSLRWLLAACLAVYIGASLVTAVVATGRSSAVLLVSLTGLAINLVGNAWLIPRLGMEGAAIATLATEVAVAVAAAIVLLRARVALGTRPWAWLAGPALFALGRALSAIP